MSEKCNCEKFDSVDIEIKFAPIKVYKMEWCCPSCGYRQRSEKVTRPGIGFAKWTDEMIQEYKDSKTQSDKE